MERKWEKFKCTSSLATGRGGEENSPVVKETKWEGREACAEDSYRYCAVSGGWSFWILLVPLFDAWVDH